MRASPASVRKSGPAQAVGDGWRLLTLSLAAMVVFALSAWVVWRLKPTAPTLPPLANQRLDEGQTLEIQTAPADLHQRRGEIEFKLIGPSRRNIHIDPRTGRLRWTPDESQGPGTHPIGVRASVIGSPHLFDEGGSRSRWAKCLSRRKSTRSTCKASRRRIKFRPPFVRTTAIDLWASCSTASK